MQPNVVESSGNDTQSNARFLPTYDAANTQYTLRLPTYRSSYLRRFHPYARISRFVEEQAPVRWLSFIFLYACLLTRTQDDHLYDEGTPLLDLHILGNSVELQLPTAAEDHTEGTLDRVPAEESPTGGVPVIIGLSTGNASDLRR